MNRIALGFAASALALAVAAPAQAESIVLDTAGSSITVTSRSTACFRNCALDARLAFSESSPLTLGDLSVGQSLVFDFANLTIGSGFGVGSATLAAVVSFVTPDISLSTNGTANYLRFGGLFTAGTVDWNSSQSIVAANGNRYTVSLNDLAGLQLGGTTTATGTISFDAIGAVPEPASWALMIVGFGAVGYSMRKRKAAVRVSYAV